MGEYKVDWNADEIIVDGHKCKKVEEGVYEVQDVYQIYDEDWMMDKCNAGLHIFALSNRSNKLREVKYVCPELHKYIIAAAKRMPKNVGHSSVFCMYTEEDHDLCNAIIYQED